MKAKEKKKKLNTYFTMSSLLTNEIQKRKTFPVSNYNRKVPGLRVASATIPYGVQPHEDFLY